MNATQKTNLNRMNRASSDVSLGTIIDGLQTGAVSASAHLVTSAESSASAIVLQTALATVNGFTIQIRSSGSNISLVNALASGSKINVLSASAAGYKILANDIVSYVAW